MFKYIIYLLLLTIITSAHDAPSKKHKRVRRPTKEEDSTPQPSVISYSTFGFNDVGSYDGFVPTSPDYASYLSNGNGESSTRLYAPAFPSAPDTTGFNGDFGQLDGFGNGDHGEPQNYPQNSMNFFSNPNFENSDAQNKYLVSNEAVKAGEEMSGPIYGTKINSKGKKNLNSNDTEFHVYSSGPVFNSNELVGRYKQQEVHDSHDSKINNGESVNNDQNMPNFVQNYPSPEINIDKQRFVKAQTNQNANFPKVVDFTNVKQYYPTELDNKYQVSTYSSILSNQNENPFPNIYENQMNQFLSPTQAIKESPYKTKLVDEENDKENVKQNINPNFDYTTNYIKPTIPSKTNYKNSLFNSDFKDNYKNKWPTENDDSDSKNFRNPLKGYEYSTDYSNTSFKYEYLPQRKPYSAEELVPASSNVDLTSYNVPDIDYSKFKKIPEVKIPFDDDDFDGQQPSRDKFKSEEFLNQFKNLYTTTPPSKWSDIFKSSDFPFKHRSKRPQYEDSINNEMVHIPKRPYNSYRHNYGSYFDSSKLNDYSKLRPHKSIKFEKPKEWHKEIANTRYKSEEDLLDLRNHDTSHPSYLPSQRPNGNDLLDDSDYKKLVEKWRQSYWKSKYRDAHRDYESFASEEKPLHVPIPKPYPIEVPHPVIVPVPQPYPVRVPVPKPVAVPVIRELNIPIEKPVPYPVIKKVPYPVEKLVPVPVEKEVQVPVIKPYPVRIPHVRPVFHHSRPPREEFESEADDADYFPRHESSKNTPPYKKRPKSTRSRPRRPTRMTYHDRSTSRRRWPASPAANRPSETRRRPSSKEYHAPYRHRDFDDDKEYDTEHTDYYYCQRTGNC